jgi:hypothetical protein
MRTRKTLRQLCGAALALVVCAGAHGALPSPGYIDFTPVMLTDGGGAPLDHAIFTDQGQAYDLRVSGLGLGGTKGREVIVTGEVHGLSNPSDLEGTFVTEMPGALAAQAASHELWLYSERGVSIRLHTPDPGIAIASGSDQVTVQFGPAD